MFKNKICIDYTMKIAIPSYNRVETLGNKTLKFLTTMRGFKHEDITIFVADLDQFTLYSAYYPEYNIVIGELGIVNIRNFISNYYEYDEYVVSLDDDIECLLPGPNPELFIEGETLLRETKFSLWGVNAVSNNYFMESQQRVSYTLKFCIGGMFGVLNKKLMLNPLAATKEDIENTILHYLHSRGIVRFNHVSFKSKMFADGGIGNKAARLFQNEQSAYHLFYKYPKLLSLFTRKDGWLECRLNHRHKF